MNKCDGPSEPAWWPNCFIVPADAHHPAFLGEGLWLVDAGDYDGDGRSEVIFWFSGYNRDGYVLFTDDWTNRVGLASRPTRSHAGRSPFGALEGPSRSAGDARLGSRVYEFRDAAHGLGDSFGIVPRDVLVDGVSED